MHCASTVNNCAQLCAQSPNLAHVPFQATTNQSGHQGCGYLLSKDEAIGWVSNVLGNILIYFSEGIEVQKGSE